MCNHSRFFPKRLMGFWNGWLDEEEEGRFTQMPTPDGKILGGKKVLGVGDFAPW